MTDIDTSKRASEMTEAQKQAFLQQCRKLAAAPKPPPVETPVSAKEMSPEQRELWMAAHRRKFK